MNRTDETFGGDDHVEVLVEDLFIEEYDKPHPLPDPRNKEGRLAKVVRPLRRNAPSLLGGLFALGGVVVATLLFGKRRASRRPRLFSRLGFAG